MEKLTTIREQLEEHLRKHGMTINRFADLSGVNSGTLSNILNGNRPISMQQLDRITSGMGLPDGYFYDLYIDECIFHATPDWRRLGPFLLRCAELDKLDCLDRAIRMTMDNVAYAPMLFDMAETLFQEGKNEAAAILYQCVAESEKFQHSERLALCQYRLFMLSLSEDQEANLQAAVSFEPYIDRLDEGYQLDAYVKLINVNLSLNRWNKVKNLAEKMLQQAMVQYRYSKSSKTTTVRRNRRQPLIFYILYAYLSLENYYNEARDYEKALHFVSLYHDPDWVIEPNAEDTKIIEQFKEWAIANRYLHRLKAGHVEVLSEYVEYISQREDEIFTAICNIMIIANLNRFNVDHILERFKEYLVFKEQRNQISKVSNQVTFSRFARLLTELGIYYLSTQKYNNGIEYILKSLENCIAINSSNGMLRCMGIFEEFRQFATDEAQKHYKKLVSEVQKLNDKKIGLSISYL
ncbi:MULTISPECIES: helix-turn-helix domain-containing protein [Paenibacillus]|uniref:Helix-turn-helix domain protein n=2 Tax=Bacillales TaxID=1385 RepID=G4HB76_9BACL|nr:helix-turn-helix transcriptional regulator [Paenibacillus lactis]EHB67185.1 helix-turn-helix domain protein [Paenibacillus lactis 154]